ncbi:hypothetical protein [Rubrivivax sp. JA1026]|uniref:hypothetical protein n=1 Tax=Rubrivivax sp. JA1026 TaxID=2710888 RepID=UPI0013E938E7|nr:hypothetical protein [Rubrivivax sp. JA1026]
MTEHLTRERLYELVWAKPRTQLAREMGVSDVWIGKQCRAMDVPMPPRGYWANLAAGAKARAKYRKPPLTYNLAQRIEAEHATAFEGLCGFVATNLEQPVPQIPSLAESVEEAAARYASIAQGLAASKRRGEHHPIVLRLLAEDERLAAESSGNSWRQPLYRGADGLYVLRVVDELAWHWTDCGFGVSASRGHDVTLSVSCGAHHTRFEVVATPAGQDLNVRGRGATALTFEFWLDRERDHWRNRGRQTPSLAFERSDKSLIDQMTRLLLAHWEKAFRASVTWRFDHAAQERGRAIRDAQQKARQERERQDAEARALLHRRQRLLVQAAAGLRRSDELRALVAAVEASASSNQLDTELVGRWKQWVLERADLIDLRTWSGLEVRRWLEAFDLGLSLSTREAGPSAGKDL